MEFILICVFIYVMILSFVLCPLGCLFSLLFLLFSIMKTICWNIICTSLAANAFYKPGEYFLCIPQNSVICDSFCYFLLDHQAIRSMNNILLQEVYWNYFGLFFLLLNSYFVENVLYCTLCQIKFLRYCKLVCSTIYMSE